MESKEKLLNNKNADLEKQLAQKDRELEIEAALERTRTQSMVMQHSTELDDTLRVFHQQVLNLGISSAFSFLWLPNEGKDRHIFWAAWAEENSKVFKSKAIDYPLDRDEPATAQCLVDWKGTEPVVSYHVPPEGVEGYFAAWQELVGGVEKLTPQYFKGGLYYVEAFMKYGCFGVMVENSLTEEEKKILGRLSVEFERTYTRFLDLKKSEEQARESQIQLALERVRARTMAMQKSEELLETSQLVFQQLRELGATADQIGIAIVKEKEGVFELFATLYGNQMLRVFRPKIDDPFVMGRVYKGWKAHQKSFVVELAGEDLRNYNIMRNKLGGSNFYNENIGPEDRWIVNCASFSKGILSFSSSKEPAKETTQLLERFAKVFEQTYTRFLDLQNAEAQARESQIQLALERVRARTMAMQHSDELADAASLLFQQVQSLGVPSWSCGYNIWEDGDKSFKSWMSNKGQLQPPFIIPLTEYSTFIRFQESRKKGEDFWVEESGGKELAARYHYLTSLPGAEKVSEKNAESGISLPEFEIIHLANFSHGNLMFITYESVPAAHDIFVRFAAVFEQTYTRFLDLQKAEEQARESQIQLALERVRARTMAMQKSEELHEVIQLIFDQLRQLDFNIDSANFSLNYRETDDFDLWIAVADAQYPTKIWLPYIKHPLFDRFKKAKQKEGLYADTLSLQEKNSFFKHLFKYTPPVAEERKALIFNQPGFARSMAFMKNTVLTIINYHGIPFAEAENNILLRFGQVFDQTYTRFKDLEQAEEQTKESQIQLALERVRARTAAMQKSAELREVIQVIYEQFVHLGLDIAVAGFTMDYRESDDWNLWMADATNSFPTLLHIPYFDHPHWNAYNEAKRMGLGTFANTLSFEEKNSFFVEIGKYVPTESGEIPEFMANAPGYTVSNVLLKNVALFIDRWSAEAFSDADNTILKRFGQVFEQTYTRFKDLEQAEEQARESQIQLGLERVRAKAMAMQTSEGLNELIGTVFSELTKLDFVLTRCLIMIFDPETKASRWWMANSELPAEPMNYLVQNHRNPAYDAYLKAWNERNLKWRYALKGKVKRDWDDFLFVDTELAQLPMPVIEGMKAPEQVLLSASFNNFGCLTLVTIEPLSDEHSDIMLRFAKVFDMCYTRFNDLKQAEEQSRESQIQLALERVRARTMAMQKSEELAETVFILFQQFKELGENPDQATIGIINEEEHVIEYWVTMHGEQNNNVYKFSVDEPNVTRKIYDAWKKKKSSLVIDLSGKELLDFMTYRAGMGGAAVNKAEKRRIINVAFFSKGLINVQSTIARSEESIRLLERFAGVFDGTYTRFLDLQKAEVQAREAKIEAALEKVRSRSLAMHKSDELKGVVAVVAEKLQELGIVMEGAVICIPAKDNKSMMMWSAMTAHMNAPPLYVSYGHPLIAEVGKEWERGIDYFAKIWSFEEKDGFWKWAFENSDFKYLPDFRKDQILAGTGYAMSAAFSKNSGIIIPSHTGHVLSDKDADTLKRFAKVFEQAYIRFMDLQKAEAQAREGQIQLGLERVRARAMAMQSSDELAELVDIVFKELTKLDFGLTHCALAIADADSEGLTLWQANSEPDQPPISFYRKPFDHPYPNATRKELKKRTQKWVYHLKGAEKQAMHDYYANSLETMNVPDAVKEGMAAYDSIVLSHSFNNFGYLRTDTVEPLSEDNLDIVYRFAKVFDLCYTRFNDIKQAEQQAREAQIQLALERVRARTMAMQRSEELAETASVLFQQLLNLGISSERTFIGIPNDDTRRFELWGTEQGGHQMSTRFEYEADATYAFSEIYKAWQEKRNEFTVVLKGKKLEEHVNYVRNVLHMPLLVGLVQKQRILYNAFFSKGLLMIVTPEIQSKETLDILGRFAAVFDGTYTRFLDLQKAEAQVRESQIQLALERVRARTAAMQNSDELAETVSVLFKQLLGLGIAKGLIRTCGIVTFDAREPVGEQWITEMNGDIISRSFMVPYDEAPAYKTIYQWWQKGREFEVNHLHGDALQEHLTYLAKYTKVPLSVLIEQSSDIYNHVLFFSQGYLFIITRSAMTEYHDVFKRLGSVFQQSYTRFLDLKRAEEQAREAQIEASLEKVRSKALAMHNSDDLSSAASLVFTELKRLGITAIRCGVGLFSKDAPVSQLYSATISTDSDALALIGRVDMVGHPVLEKIYDGWRKQVDYFPVLNGKELKNFYEKISPGLNMPSVSDMGANEKQYGHFLYFTEGALNTWAERPYSEPELKVLDRFKSIISLTFRRYLDLKKAEAQARESQIQLGLERVRAAAMAMHDSAGVGDATALVFSELYKLDITTIRCGICIIDGTTQQMEVWSATSPQEGKVNRGAGSLDMRTHPLWLLLWDAWKQKISNFSYELKGKELTDYYDIISHAPSYGAPDNQALQLSPGNAKNASQHCNCYVFNEGCLFTFTEVPFSAEISQVLEKFTAVFGLTYRRYLDLTRAEAQAREAQIEAALEKVRSRSLAMHKSDELKEVVTVVFDKLRELGLPFDSAVVVEFITGSKDMLHWIANEDFTYPRPLFVPYSDLVFWKNMSNARQSEDFFTKVYTREINGPTWKIAFETTDYRYVPDDRKALILNSEVCAFSMAPSKNSAICIISFSGQVLSEPGIDLIKRMGRVFEQAYVRFLDLQKAEAQAREAQIEAALERVRSKTMAMHNSADVGETVTLMFNELIKLGVDKIARCGIAIPDNNGLVELWTAKLGKDEKEEMIIGYLDINIHPMLSSMYDAWKSKQLSFEYILEGDDLTDYIAAINNSRGYPIKYESNAWGTKQYHNDFFFHEGMVFAFTFQPLSAEIAAIFKRFAGVFGQTYRRYLDLRRAEANAREAQIEAALERVRAKAMAMRSSDDLNATANTVFIELRKLGVDLVRCGVGLLEKQTRISTIHAATNTAGGASLELLGKLNMEVHPVLVGIHKHWRQNEDYFPVLEGKSLKDYYKRVREAGIPVPALKGGEKQYGYFFQFPDGCLYAWSEKQESEDTLKTFKRFTSVIGLTYTRYMELQKAESNAKEAIKQASLDRVRAEIASMRKRNDLERITPLIWDELTILGIPFIRCGVFIMDEEQQFIHTFLSTPDGKAIGAFHVPYNTSESFEKIVNNWRHKEPYIDHWKEEAFSQFADTLLKQGAIASKAQYMRTLPHEGIHLNFLPFLQGMLYVGNAEQLNQDDLTLIQAVADAFSTAYARYEDFNKLEAAKEQVDNTLTQLKATQTKLIQSEKMASLGELTAGIAHEIQNPLNFVNNFSEVNQEMIDELEEELKAGNIEDALAIAADIKQNEQKINHHGKRADGIVKGMLQHSRTGGGEKQLTNMNVLADEFLRLSYHGLRAKDKTFNAEMVTHFDADLPKISVVPQDIGRVLLNLFNNAFYAVNQKMKTAGAGYKPEVSVTTVAEKGNIIIKVKDNGNGIPDAIKDKIMQPFFTTKPTGEGTGLGLSLSYDIVVKGHGGKIEVDTREGDYTEFTVTLPIA